MNRTDKNGANLLPGLLRTGTAVLFALLCFCVLFLYPAFAQEAGPEDQQEIQGEEAAAETENVSEAEDAAEAQDTAETEDAADTEETQIREIKAPLYMGMTGDDVLEMQNALKKLDYFGKDPDGVYEEDTLTAVKKFQLFNGLPITGEADRETLSVLYKDDAEYLRPLYKGTSGKAVQNVQQYLLDTGFSSLSPDGSFGPYTEAAVKVYQAEANLDSPDGSIGDLTISRMIDEDVFFKPLDIGDEGTVVLILQEKLKELKFLNADPSGIFDASTERAVKKFQMYSGMDITGKADADTINAIYRKTVSFSPLYKGSKGTQVKILQTMLKDLGYLTDEPDGSFGSNTAKAVRDFQVVNELSRDGSFGWNTADKMFDDPASCDPEILANAGNDAEAFAREKLDQIGWDLYTAYKWSVGITYVGKDTGHTTTESAIYAFINYRGNCVSMASTFYWMAKALGYEAYVIFGSVPLRDSEEFGDHAWVEIIIDGVKYVCDPDFEMQTKTNGYKIYYGQPGTWQYRYGFVMND